MARRPARPAESSDLDARKAAILEAVVVEHINSAAPVGAITYGIDIGLPNNVVAVERPETSFNTRGRNLMRSKAARLLRSPTSSSVARSMNSNRPFGSRRRASSRRSAML